MIEKEQDYEKEVVERVKREIKEESKKKRENTKDYRTNNKWRWRVIIFHHGIHFFICLHELYVLVSHSSAYCWSNFTNRNNSSNI